MRIRNFSLVAVAAISVMSCSDYDNGFDSVEFKHQELESVYTKNFVDRYGQIDPNHNWGFGPITGELSTRGNVPNKNEWESIYHLTIPGFPDIYQCNGETVNGGYSLGGDNHYYEFDESKKYNGVPAGDVTDEEIEYVSCWFRTHYKPSTQVVHCTDFYIQEVSSDFDRNADGTVDDQVTRFFFDNNNAKDWVVTKEKMNDFGYDQLRCKSMEVATGDWNNYDHIYNFNSGASNKLHSVKQVSMDMDNPYTADGFKDANGNTVTTKRRMCDFYTSAGTEDFVTHYSNDDTWRNNYVLVHLTFTGKSGREYDGYYIAFDYEFYKTEETFGQDDEYGHKAGTAKKYVKKDFDGYYSNWILKLTPAEPIDNTPFSRRILCEDLGNTYDFDFNDVVFDVTYNTRSVENFNNDHSGNPVVDATITIRAAGGTMPIYVGKDPRVSADNEFYEIHNLLGNNPTNMPVNVGFGTATSAIANYHVTLESINPDDIPIYVVNNGEVHEIRGANANMKNYLSPDKINAPQKICVPNTVRWMKEEQQIEWGYGYFKEWVKNLDQYSASSEVGWYDLHRKESEKGGSEEDYLY